MIKTKILFSFLILFSLAIIIVGSIYSSQINSYNFFEQVEEKVDIGRIINLVLFKDITEYECEIKKPEEKTIIFRIDDIRAFNRLEPSKEIVNLITENNMSITLGVIPNELKSDSDLVDWLRDIKGNENIEIAQHGYLHTVEEFKTLDKETALEKLENGRKIIQDILFVNPITFIPPYNEYSTGTILALEELEYKIISAKRDEYLISENFAYIGYDAKTFNFGTSEYISSEQVIRDCKQSLKQTGICTIMLHPQDFTDENKNIDQDKFSDFTYLLEELQELDVEFKTFNKGFCE